MRHDPPILGSKSKCAHTVRLQDHQLRLLEKCVDLRGVIVALMAIATSLRNLVGRVPIQWQTPSLELWRWSARSGRPNSNSGGYEPAVPTRLGWKLISVFSVLQTLRCLRRIRIYVFEFRITFSPTCFERFVNKTLREKRKHKPEGLGHLRNAHLSAKMQFSCSLTASEPKNKPQNLAMHLLFAKYWHCQNGTRMHGMPGVCASTMSLSLSGRRA